MPAKGTKHTDITRRKLSLQRQKLTNTDQISAAQSYIDELKASPDQLPNKATLALRLGISKSRILEAIAKNPDLEPLIETIQTMQEEFLLTRGIANKTNPAITTLLLKSKHGYQETPPNLTQNNNFNISPDILRLALDRMK